MKPLLLKHYRVRYEPPDDGGEEGLVFSSEGKRLVFRWQLFNTFNHNNPANPDTRIDAPASVAAHITNVQQNMRRMQMGLHLYF